MSWSNGSIENIQRLKQKIQDLELCIDGNRASQRWQTINTELVNARESLRCLEEKAVNIIPRQSRDYP